MAYVADLLKGSLSSKLMRTEQRSKTDFPRPAPKLQSWLDTRANHFFKIYPEALGIEIAGAISTRFHRLSLRSDWPRFSWALLCESGLFNKVNAALPITDGLTIVENENYPFEVALKEKAQKHAICLVIAGEASALGETELMQLVAALKPLCMDGVSMELLVSLKSKKLLRALSPSGYRVLASSELGVSVFATPQPRISMLPKAALSVCAAHIKLLPITQ